MARKPIDLDKDIIEGFNLTFDQVDSWEEAHFVWWALEMMEAGYIHRLYRAVTYDLSDFLDVWYEVHLKTKTNKKHKCILQPHEYTPDFQVEWTPKGHKKLLSVIDRMVNPKSYFWANDIDGRPVSIIEVKPSFDKNNMTRLARVNIKWVLQKYGLYVQIVDNSVVMSKRCEIKNKNCLFNSTFMPKRYLQTDNSRIKRKISYEYQTIEQWQKSI